MLTLDLRQNRNSVAAERTGLISPRIVSSPGRRPVEHHSGYLRTAGHGRKDETVAVSAHIESCVRRVNARREQDLRRLERRAPFPSQYIETEIAIQEEQLPAV